MSLSTISTGLQAACRQVKALNHEADSEHNLCSNVREKPEFDNFHVDQITFDTDVCRDKSISIVMKLKGETHRRNEEHDRDLAHHRETIVCSRDRFWKWESVVGSDGGLPTQVDMFEWTCEMAKEHGLKVSDLMICPMEPFDAKKPKEVCKLSAEWLSYVDSIRTINGIKKPSSRTFVRPASQQWLDFAERIAFGSKSHE